MNTLTGAERDARQTLTLEATYQIEALSNMLLDEIEALDIGGIHGLKSAVIRMRALSTAIMSAMDDDTHTTADIHRVVHGRFPVPSEPS